MRDMNGYVAAGAAVGERALISRIGRALGVER